jgi:hypothetical protein
MKACSKMKLILLSFLLVATFSASAQDGPKPFSISGTEISISDLPTLKGIWFNNVRDNKFTVDKGNYATWIGGKCGLDFRPIKKAFKENDTLIIETGPSNDSIRCSEQVGMFIKINLITKSGTYHLKTTNDSMDVRFEGKITLD